MIKGEPEAWVEGLGDIYQLHEPWDCTLSNLTACGAKYPINTRDLAYARIHSPLIWKGSYVAEGGIFVPNSSVLFVRESPLMVLKNAREATEAHRNNREFYIDPKKYQERAEANRDKSLDKKRVLELKQRGLVIPTDKFEEEETTLWLFLDQAGPYGELLRENGIDKILIGQVDEYDVNKEKQAFARQLWFDSLEKENKWYLSGLTFWGIEAGFDQTGLVRYVLNKK